MAFIYYIDLKPGWTWVQKYIWRIIHWHIGSQWVFISQIFFLFLGWQIFNRWLLCYLKDPGLSFTSDVHKHSSVVISVFNSIIKQKEMCYISLANFFADNVTSLPTRVSVELSLWLVQSFCAASEVQEGCKGVACCAPEQLPQSCIVLFLIYSWDF